MTQQSSVATENARPCEETRPGQRYRPNVDILEHENELVVLADVPGAIGDKIDIDFAEGILSVYAPIEEPKEECRRYLAREFGRGDFYRSFRVSQQIDPSGITAECADGVLTLHLPKAESIKPRKISVQTHS